MKVSELVEKLRECPPDAEVWHLWHGAARTAIELVYVARSGHVVTSDWEMVAYNDEDRPVDAPTEADNRYWKTPAPKGDYD